MGERSRDRERGRSRIKREKEIPLSLYIPVQSCIAPRKISLPVDVRAGVSRKKPRYWWATGVLIFWYDTATTRWSHRSSTGSAPPYLFPSGRPGRDCGKRIFQGLLPPADPSPFHVSTDQLTGARPCKRFSSRFPASRTCFERISGTAARTVRARPIAATLPLRAEPVNNVHTFDRWLLIGPIERYLSRFVGDRFESSSIQISGRKARGSCFWFCREGALIFLGRDLKRYFVIWIWSISFRWWRCPKV